MRRDEGARFQGLPTTIDVGRRAPRGRRRHVSESSTRPASTVRGGAAAFGIFLTLLGVVLYGPPLIKPKQGQAPRPGIWEPRRAIECLTGGAGAP